DIVYRQPFGAEEKLRTGENGCQPIPNRGVEIASLPRGPVEAQRRLKIALGDRPAKCPPRKGRKDLRGARELFTRFRRRRAAHEDPFAAGRLADARGTE